MSDKKEFPYAKHLIDDADIEAVCTALRQPVITRGQTVKEFETAVATYCNADYAVAFSHGTAALQAAFHVTEISPSDRIYTSPNSFIGTVTGALQKGAAISFVEIDEETGLMDLAALEEQLKEPVSRGRKVLLPAHFGGMPVHMGLLERMVTEPSTVIIEDASHALGAVYPSGEKVGCCKWSDLTIFSFHPVEGITTGEGGVVTTHDEDLYHRLIRFRDNGIQREKDRFESAAPQGPWYYEVQELSGNYHLTDFQAALGMNQLKKLDQLIQRRREIAARYLEHLWAIPNLSVPPEAGRDLSSWHLFPVRVDFKAINGSRTALMEALKEKGIESQVHYIPLYRHPVFSKYRVINREPLPITEAYYAAELSLPIYPSLTDEEVDHICVTLGQVMSEIKK